MATIYLQDDAVERIDKLLEKYNETHAATERSAFLHYVLDLYEKNTKK